MEAEFETTVTLRARVRIAREEPGRPLVIALHGWGMSDRSFLRWLEPGIGHRVLNWWLPRGILPCEVRSRRIGYAWYVFDGDQAALRESMDQARAYLAGLAALARRRLDPSSITLLGFSQGAYLASYAALGRPDLFDRLVLCCGRPKSEFVDDLAAARHLPVLLLTGDRDEGMPPEVIARGADPLRAAGFDVVQRGFDTTHRITPEMARAAAEFADGAAPS